MSQVINMVYWKNYIGFQVQQVSQSQLLDKMYACPDETLLFLPYDIFHTF